jgi:hypothetical protein
VAFSEMIGAIRIVARRFSSNFLAVLMRTSP